MDVLHYIMHALLMMLVIFLNILQIIFVKHCFLKLACVAALLDGGCNPSLANLGGHKPIEYASSDAMKQLIESYATKVFI